MFRRMLLGLFALLAASGFLPGAFGASAETAPLEIGALAQVTLGETPAEFSFTPAANGQYSVCLFPETEDVRAEAQLMLDGEVIAGGMDSVSLLSCRLTAGTEYTLSLTGSGAGRVEIARETLSRSFTMPIELADGEGYSKLLARPGDVHWYAVTAETSGAALIACEPEIRDLRMDVKLFSAGGRLLLSGETLISGTSVTSAAFESGETYLLRISAPGGATGKYGLNVLRSENSVRPETVDLSGDELSIEGRSTGRLEYALYPEDSCPLVYLDTSDSGVAVVRPDGWVEGRRAGDAIVTAYAYGGARSTCRVSVGYVGVEDVSIAADDLVLAAGDRYALPVSLLPANATDRTLTYHTDSPDVISVEKGVITALREGEATVTVRAEDGGLTDSVSVTVYPAQRKYRALLVGEQDYAESVETKREGSVASVSSIMSLINSTSFGYNITMMMDAPRDGVLAGIRRCFADAREEDVSLLYLTCHGFYRAGMTYFIMADGSVLSAHDLERELARIPGEIILMVDCCGSGGVLGEANSTSDILDGIGSVFTGAAGGTGLRSSKYKVIASARLDEDSHRLGFTEGNMTTVFARALCDAAGWSVDRDAPSSMSADTNYNGEITLDELDSYLSRRVKWYLSLAGDYDQNVCVYPQGDNSVIFERNE